MVDSVLVGVRVVGMVGVVVAVRLVGMAMVVAVGVVGWRGRWWWSW